MKTLAFDTSVLLRLIVASPTDQFRSARQFLQKQKGLGNRVFVSDLVLSEAYFALQAHYGLSKEQAITAMTTLIQSEGFETPTHTTALLNTSGLHKAKPGFVDRMIHGEAVDMGALLVTFEKAAKRLGSTKVLSA